MNQSQQPIEPNVHDDEIDLRELFRVLWAGKWIIGGITSAATIISVIVALMLPNIYRAEALLAPNEQEAAGGLSTLASQYGGLASLAGINLRGGQIDKTALGLEVLKSRKFISAFIVRHDILVPLMAAKGWNSNTGELEIDSSKYNVNSQKWIRDVSPPKNATPSPQEAYEVFRSILTVSTDRNTGFVTVAVEHHSPTLAKKWVDWLVSDLNSWAMNQDVTEAEEAIEFLNQQIDKTSLAELQNIFFNLIEDQTKTVMLARVSDEYLLKTLDPAVAPEKKHKPRRSLIVIIGMVFGCFVGVLLTSVSNRGRH